MGSMLSMCNGKRGRVNMIKSIMQTIAISMLVLGSGCIATVTKIYTDPIGAKLYINGEYVGETPAVYHDRLEYGQKYHIQLQKDAYELVDFYFYNNGQGLSNEMKIHLRPLSQDDKNTVTSTSSNTEKF